MNIPAYAEKPFARLSPQALPFPWQSSIEKHTSQLKLPSPRSSIDICR